MKIKYIRVNWFKFVSRHRIECSTCTNTSKALVPLSLTSIVNIVCSTHSLAKILDQNGLDLSEKQSQMQRSHHHYAKCHKYVDTSSDFSTLLVAMNQDYKHDFARFCNRRERCTLGIFQEDLDSQLS